jgi:hypothetical protein
MVAALRADAERRQANESAALARRVLALRGSQPADQQP